MTQEEIQQKAYEVYPLELDRHMIIEGEPYDNNKEKREAYIKGLTDSKPSPPSNLDEAAIRAANEMGIPTDNSQPESLTLVMRHIAAQMFKAGAEWMAEQFQKIDGSLDDWYETNDVEYCYGIRANEAFEVPEGFYIKKK